MKFTGERFIPDGQTDKELIIEHFQRYEAIKKLIKGKKILDAASGEGYGSYILAEYAEKVYGLDIERQAVEEATSKYQRENLEFIQGSIAELPFSDKTLDVVVSFETIEHVDEMLQIEFMKEVKRVLKEDGILIISTPNKKIYSDEFNYQNEFHVKEFYKDEFINFINSYFKYHKLYSQYKEVSYQITSNEINKILDIKGYNEEAAKYYICIASNKKINDIQIASIINEEEKTYINLMHRILKLQQEVEERNRHINQLNIEEENRVQRIISLQEEVEERNRHINQLDIEGQNRIQRIVSLQEEVEERNNHIIYLDREIEGQKEAISHLQSNLGEKEKMMKEALEEIKQMTQNNNKYITQLEIQLKRLEEEKSTLEHRLKEKSNEISDLETQLQNTNEINESYKESLIRNESIEIELNEIKEEIGQIYRSTGWRILVKLYKFRDRVCPENSKRRLIAKLSKKAMKNPKLYWKNLSKDNIKKLKYYMNSENVERVVDRLESFDEKHTVVSTPAIQTFEVKSEYEKIIFEYQENPKVSIIIPVYNQWEYTYNCLMSIKENTKDISYEIIIADDVSQDETKNINNYIENIKVVRNEKNLGFLLNCNNAAKHARGQYIHFLNNDTNVQANWLTSLVELIESNKSIGMVGSKLVYANGKLQEAGGIIWNDASGWNYGRLDDPNKPEYNYVKDVDYISGASILIKTDLWKEIGGFDERYVPAYFEDSDLAFEVRKHGYRVVYQPKSVVVHFEGISHGTDVGQGIKSYQIKNREKFIEKWNIELSQKYENAQHVFRARDNSENKKTLLMIDHYVPHFDKDAGSRTVFQYLNMFIKQGFNVKFIGDNFFQHEPYTEVLQQVGVEVLYGEYYAKNWRKWIKDNSEYIDYIFLNRPHISEKYIDFVNKNTHAKVIYYGHDLHFLRETREYELTKNEETLKNAQRWQVAELDLMRKADVTYYPSQVEVDEIKKIDAKINAKAIPAYIFDMYTPEIKYNSTSRKDAMFIGGFGHRPNVDAVIWFAEEILPEILKKQSDFKVYILGSNPPQEVKKLASDNLIIKGFVTDEELQQFYNECKLAIVPLRYGAGIKGKVVEAMYNQIPVVTTSVGAEGIIDAENILTIADEPQIFADKLLSLYKNDALLEDISKISRKYIGEYFTVDAVIQTIKNDFDMNI